MVTKVYVVREWYYDRSWLVGVFTDHVAALSCTLSAPDRDIQEAEIGKIYDDEDNQAPYIRNQG